MHIIIDILAVIVLLIFFARGWRRGLLVSLLGIVRVILAYGVSYYAGRYLGSWLGTALHRPRIVMIPVTAGLTFVVINYVFHIVMWKLRVKYRSKKEEEDLHLPWFRSLGGGVVSMATGLLSMVFIFWLCDLSMTGLTGKGIPGAGQSMFGQFSRRAVYEGIYDVTKTKGHESQAAAMARVISNPAEGMDLLEKVLSADSIKRLLADPQLPNDILSGNPERIRNNAAMQQLFKDHATHRELQALGIISRKETEAAFCQKLSRFGQNKKIRQSIKNLKERGLLRTDKILELIRDPDFDVIVGQVVK